MATVRGAVSTDRKEQSVGLSRTAAMTSSVPSSACTGACRSRVSASTVSFTRGRSHVISQDGMSAPLSASSSSEASTNLVRSSEAKVSTPSRQSLDVARRCRSSVTPWMCAHMAASARCPAASAASRLSL